MLALCIYLFFAMTPGIYSQDEMQFKFQESSPNWVVLKSSNGIKFSPRNAHATCIYKNKIWVTGGKTDLYKMYNTLFSYKAGDVWNSADTGGGNWEQQGELMGDFYAQNADAKELGPLAPWYTRFGHTLNAIDMNNDGVEDAMIQLGGFAPGPMNDIWITTDGQTWIYCGTADWSPRAWHSTLNYKQKLYVMGGSPLNNEVWLLGAVTKVPRRPQSTRSMYFTYTYTTQWTLLGNANWSPRAAMSIVSQEYFRPESPYNETIANSTARMVFTGGFGGYLDGTMEYDGYRSRADVWDSYDGLNWTMIAEEAFPARAWHTVAVLHEVNDTTLDVVDSFAEESMGPRLWMVGGGYIGGSTFSTRITIKMTGLTDFLFSRRGDEWQRVNYEQGNGVRKYDTFVQYYCSQEWTQTIVDSKMQYLGMWGMTSVYIDGNFILIGGDKAGAGPLQSETYLALAGIYCDIDGSICSGHGACIEPHGGCACEGGFLGLYCEIDTGALALAAA